MAVYYLDASALAKRYVLEVGNRWVVGITNPVSGHDIFIVRIPGPEIIAALFRKARARELSQRDASRAAANFKFDLTSQCHILEVTPGLADRAMTLAQAHSLRGYDAVQLAAAAELHILRNGMGLTPLTFVSADGELNKAAQSEGLAVDDPDSHP